MELVESLVKELQVTREQAEGGAGLLLQLASKKLSADEFTQVADTIPAISDLLAKSPRGEMRFARPLQARLRRWVGGLGHLSSVADGFATIGLDRPIIPRFVDTLLATFRSRGGPEVETILRSVLW